MMSVNKASIISRKNLIEEDIIAQLLTRIERLESENELLLKTK
jgi:hypothetical protein